MTKKLIVVIVAFIVLAIGGFVLWQKLTGGSNNAAVANLTNMLSPSDSAKGAIGELSSGSVVNSLSDKVMALAVLTPRNFDSLTTHLENIRAKFAKTALWQKAGLDKIIDQYMHESVNDIAAPAVGDALAPAAAALEGSMTPAEILSVLNQEWSHLTEVAFTLSSETFEPLPGMKVPRVLIAANFVDEPSREYVRGLVLNKLLGGQQSITTPDGMTIKKANEAGTKILMSAPSMSPDQPSTASGSIEFDKNHLFVSLGSDDYKTFLSASKGGSATGAALVDSPRWADMKNGVLEQPAVFGYYDAQQLLPLLEQTMAMLDPALNPATGGAGAISPPGLKSLEAFAVSLSVSNGVSARSCFTIARGNDLAKVYADAFASPAAPRDAALLKLVDDKTFLAGNLSGQFIKLYASASRAIRVGAAAASAVPQSEEWQKFQRTYEALGKLLAKRTVRDLGLLVNAPRPEQMAMLMSPQGSPPLPDIGGYIEFETSTSLQDIAQMINDIAVLLAGDSGLLKLPIAEVAPGAPTADGSTPFAQVIRISFGPETQLVAAPASDHALIIAKDELMLSSLAKKLSSGSGVISAQTLADRGLGGKAERSDSFAVLSTSPLVDIARGFVPMGLMMTPPDMQIGMPEVEEVLKLLTFRLYGVQNSYKVAEGLYCSEGHGVAL